MFNSRDYLQDFPCLRIGSRAQVFKDPPHCTELEGPALLVRNIGTADACGFEPWLVQLETSTRLVLRYVHPFDLIFTLGPSAVIAAGGDAAWPGNTTRKEGTLHEQ